MKINNKLWRRCLKKREKEEKRSSPYGYIDYTEILSLYWNNWRDNINRRNK